MESIIHMHECSESGLKLKFPGSCEGGVRGAHPAQGLQGCIHATVQGGPRSPGVLLRLDGREFGGGSSGLVVTHVCTGAGQGTAISYRSVGLGEDSSVLSIMQPKGLLQALCCFQR